MNFFAIFTIWLTFFSLAFSFLPILVIAEWKKRGTAEGFSSVNFVLPLLMMACWCRQGLMTNDAVNIYLNAVNLVIFSCYVVAFAYYQPIRKYLYGQVIALLSSLYFIFSYVDRHADESRAELMAAIAAGTQIVGLFGGVYDIKRAIDLRTTEYIPASIQWGIFALTIQWTFFGYWIGNWYMVGANLAGLVVNVVTLCLYVIYPPKTWRVPILGTGGEGVREKKKQ
ncbi:Sugar transporter SWEET [Aphelenchoides fujianensis]|nr:Sugar transporter SWEET [Aphelenchoides fujianensis]